MLPSASTTSAEPRSGRPNSSTTSAGRVSRSVNQVSITASRTLGLVPARPSRVTRMTASRPSGVTRPVIMERSVWLDGAADTVGGAAADAHEVEQAVGALGLRLLEGFIVGLAEEVGAGGHVHNQVGPIAFALDLPANISLVDLPAKAGYLVLRETRTVHSISHCTQMSPAPCW